MTAVILAGDDVGWYARFVEFGTLPHRINPSNSQGSLYIGGRWNPPGKGVDHPGSRARPFFYGPYRARKKTAKKMVARAVSKAIKEVGGE